MSDPHPFEIEDEPSPSLDPSVQPPPAPEPVRARESPRADEAPPVAPRDPEGALSFLDERRKRRLARFVPAMAIAFLLVGWLLVGGPFWVFGLVGAAVGVFAAWRRRSDVLLGTVSAVAGTATALLTGGVIAGVSGALVIVTCGAIGFLAALDDRLRGG